MAEHHLPVRGATSDGNAVAIDEVELGFLTQLAGWDRFGAAADAALRSRSLSLPGDYRTPVRRGKTTAWRIACDRVLVRSETALDFPDSDDIVTLDLSQARVCLTLGGPGAADLLSRVMPIDFSEAAFPAGTFAQASLHHVGVLVDRHGCDEFDLLIPTTWATSLTSLMANHLSAVA